MHFASAACACNVNDGLTRGNNIVGVFHARGNMKLVTAKQIIGRYAKMRVL